MKHEPISSHEKPHIIQHLAQHPKWQGTRKGRFVQIFRMRTMANVTQIFFIVGKHPTLPATTVADAIEQINRLIMSRDPQKEAEDALSRGETHL